MKDYGKVCDVLPGSIHAEHRLLTVTAQIEHLSRGLKRDAILVFYQFDRDASGNISDISLNFVAGGGFEKTYDVIREQGTGGWRRGNSRVE
ncbi:MAG: hypothetical protein IKF09_09930 [Clostridiales bacterium]|nr:hypothetical protein [Clostridiales bacterium]